MYVFATPATPRRITAIVNSSMKPTCSWMHCRRGTSTIPFAKNDTVTPEILVIVFVRRFGLPGLAWLVLPRWLGGVPEKRFCFTRFDWWLLGLSLLYLGSCTSVAFFYYGPEAGPTGPPPDTHVLCTSASCGHHFVIQEEGGFFSAFSSPFPVECPNCQRKTGSRALFCPRRAPKECRKWVVPLPPRKDPRGARYGSDLPRCPLCDGTLRAGAGTLLAESCGDDADCDGGDICTNDVCVGGFCDHLSIDGCP